VHPTFEVHGIVSGYTGPGVKTQSLKGRGEISMRLVPNQNPAKIFRLVKSFIKKRNPDVQIFPESFLKPYLGQNPDHMPMRREMRWTAFGKEPSWVEKVDPSARSPCKYLKAPIVFWVSAAGAFLPLQRKFRLGTGLRRNPDVCTLL
jgi:hypothetical protein